MYQVFYDGINEQEVWSCERPVNIFSLKKMFWIENGDKVPVVTRVQGVNDSSFSLSGKVVFSGRFDNDWMNFLNIIDFFNDVEYLYWTDPCEHNYYSGCVGYYSPSQLKSRLTSDYPYGINGGYTINTQYLWDTCTNLIELCLDHNYI